MAASVEYRLEEMSSGETTEKEKSEDLSLVDFNDNNLNLKHLQNSDQFQETLGSESRNPLIPKTIPIRHGQNHPGADGLLNSEDKSTDYDWLRSPPRNPTLSLEMEEENLKSNGESIGPQSRVENPPARRRPASTTGVKSSSGALRRPSPSTTIKPLRSSTPPMSRAMVAATKPKRSITPMPPRPSILPATKSTSRSSTPTQRPSNPSVTKSRHPTLKNNPLTESQAPPNSKKSLPETNSKAMPKRSSCSPSRGQVSISNGLTKKSLPERPASAPRGRTETNYKAIPKRSSRSPSRGKVSNGYLKGDDDVNPVLMGTKMVERVVNMRKLPPPNHNNNNTCSKLSASQDNSGFGRTLSKKSFDMALRHLDIRRSMPGNMRAMITKVPASSVYSVRLESTKPPTTSALDSPHATGSSASSDY